MTFPNGLEFYRVLPMWSLSHYRVGSQTTQEIVYQSLRGIMRACIEYRVKSKVREANIDATRSDRVSKSEDYINIF